jgi:hypothetical protein
MSVRTTKFPKATIAQSKIPVEEFKNEFELEGLELVEGKDGFECNEILEPYEALSIGYSIGKKVAAEKPEKLNIYSGYLPLFKKAIELTSQDLHFIIDTFTYSEPNQFQRITITALPTKGFILLDVYMKFGELVYRYEQTNREKEIYINDAIVNYEMGLITQEQREQKIKDINEKYSII